MKEEKIKIVRKRGIPHSVWISSLSNTSTSSIVTHLKNNIENEIFVKGFEMGFVKIEESKEFDFGFDVVFDKPKMIAGNLSFNSENFLVIPTTINSKDFIWDIITNLSSINQRKIDKKIIKKHIKGICANCFNNIPKDTLIAEGLVTDDIKYISTNVGCSKCNNNKIIGIVENISKIERDKLYSIFFMKGMTPISIQEESKLELKIKKAKSEFKTISPKRLLSISMFFLSAYLLYQIFVNRIYDYHNFIGEEQEYLGMIMESGLNSTKNHFIFVAISYVVVSLIFLPVILIYPLNAISIYLVPFSIQEKMKKYSSLINSFLIIISSLAIAYFLYNSLGEDFDILENIRGEN